MVLAHVIFVRVEAPEQRHMKLNDIDSKGKPFFNPWKDGLNDKLRNNLDAISKRQKTEFIGEEARDLLDYLMKK